MYIKSSISYFLIIPTIIQYCVNKKKLVSRSVFLSSNTNSFWNIEFKCVRKTSNNIDKIVFWVGLTLFFVFDNLRTKSINVDFWSKLPECRFCVKNVDSFSTLLKMSVFVKIVKNVSFRSILLKGRLCFIIVEIVESVVFDVF